MRNNHISKSLILISPLLVVIFAYIPSEFLVETQDIKKMVHIRDIKTAIFFMI